MTQHPPLLLRTSSSIRADDRQRRTHILGIIPILKKLSLERRLERNYDIERANEARQEKTMLFIEKKAPAKGSPSASLITITEDEWNDIRTTPAIFERVKQWIPSYILAWMSKANEVEILSRGKRTREVQEGDALENGPEKNPRLMTPIIETTPDPTTPQNVELPECLYRIGRLHNYLPLPLFTDNNLIFIHSHSSSFKTSKTLLPGDKERTEVVVLKDLLDRLNIRVPDVEKADEDEGLSLYEFQLASKNYFAFELSRDPDGQEGTRTNWTRQHFLFFNNQRDAEKYYRFWKPREYRLREEHRLYNTKFDLTTYNMAWNRVVTDYERSLEAKPRQAPNLSAAPSSSKPFQKGNKGDSFDLCCLGCGKKGHSATDHSSKHGSLLWARWIKGGKSFVLGLPQGEDKRICYQWNIRGNCKANKGCQDAHVCTFCGSDGHHAFSYTCCSRPN
ncbi:hypothetical protein F5876DRAFT_70247 [Lentinula aff. lateritia]|uniref:Uncharacterized protein n=1 Tax=Lentinula aff. lateritia TaxID=2804960 RepID=A0ACC1TJH7_9AGAR|nr:hypothetical protein F5876DRAFT_70247 [Lentinula aff. lateritia]